MSLITFPSPYVSLSPRLLTSADPSERLSNVNTGPLPDGATCFAIDATTPGMFRLDKSSAAVADGVNVVAPASGGPGRWLRITQGAADACDPGQFVYVDGATVVPAPGQDGTWCSPFSTIQAALDFIGSQPTTGSWTVDVAPGLYAGDLTIAPKDDLGILFTTTGTVFVDGSLTWGFGTGGSGNLLNFSDAFIIYDGMVFTAALGSPGGTLSTRCSAAEPSLRILSGGINASGVTPLANLNILLTRAFVDGNLVGSALTEVQASWTTFSGTVSARFLGEMAFCTFQGNITTSETPLGVDRRWGYYSCDFSGVTINCAEPAFFARMDSVSIRNFHLGSGVFGANVSLERADDALDSSVNVAQASPYNVLDGITARVIYITSNVLGAVSYVVNLPAAANVHLDDEFLIKDMTGSVSVGVDEIDVTPNGTDTIDNAAVYSITTAYGYVRVKRTSVAAKQWSVIAEG